MNGGKCDVYLRIQCVHAVHNLRACLPFLLIGFRESTATVGDTLSPPRDISMRENVFIPPTLRLIPPSLPTFNVCIAHPKGKH